MLCRFGVDDDRIRFAKIEFAVEQFQCDRNSFVDTLGESIENRIGETQVSGSNHVIDLGATNLKFVDIALIKIELERVQRVEVETEGASADLVAQALSGDVIPRHQLGDHPSDLPVLGALDQSWCFVLPGPDRRMLNLDRRGEGQRRDDYPAAESPSPTAREEMLASRPTVWPADSRVTFHSLFLLNSAEGFLIATRIGGTRSTASITSAELSSLTPSRWDRRKRGIPGQRRFYLFAQSNQMVQWGTAIQARNRLAVERSSTAESSLCCRIFGCFCPPGFRVATGVAQFPR